MIKIQYQNRATGFSLVEIVIALAIASVALVSMMALLGSFFPMSGNSKDRFASVRIFQTLSHEVQMMTWDELLKAETNSSGVRYFSEQGEEVAREDFEATYAAIIEYNLLGNWPNVEDPSITGHQVNMDANRRVTISVSNKGTSEDPFADPRGIRELTIMVTRFDK